MSKKGLIAWDEIIRWLIVLAVIIALLVAIFIISGASSSIFDRIKNIFRFGA